MPHRSFGIKGTAALLLAGLLLLLPACKRDTGADRDFYAPISANPERLDPQIAVGTPAETILLNCMEGLVRIAADGSVQPGVAESWEISSDGQTLSFHLREDAKWYTSKSFYDSMPDGFFDSFNTKVTAQDFVFAFRRAVTPSISSPHAEKLDLIKNAKQIRAGKAKPESLGVTAADENTLTITLTGSGEELLPGLAFAPFYPCPQEFYEATQGRYGLEPRYLLCNGPFYLSRWQENSSSVILRKNPVYSGQEAVLPASVTLQVDSNSARYPAILGGGMYSVCPLESAADLPSGGRLVSVGNRTIALAFNCGYVNDKIRAALARVPDLSQFSAQGLVPQSALLGGEQYREQAGTVLAAKTDAAKAKLTLAQEIEKQGISTFELTILCPAEYEHDVRLLQQQWNAAFGLLLKAGLEVKSEREIQTRAEKGDFQAAVLPLTLRGQSPYSLLAQFGKDSADNIFGYSSAKYQTLLDELQAAKSTQAALEAAKKAEEFLLNAGVAMPLFAGESAFATGKNVGGVVFAFGSLPDFRGGTIKG
jgi:ABC-type oligopeptide transport system substrate-binding subunit